MAPVFTFTRTTGKPRAVHETFTLGERSRLCIRILNNAGENGRIVSAHVSIDGTEVSGPSDYNQHITEITKKYPDVADRTVAEGEHSLDAVLASNPGGSLDVEVRAVRAFSPSEAAAVADLGTLNQLACEQFNQRLSTLGPDLGREAINTALRIGLVPGQMLVRLNAHGVPRLIDPIPVEDFGQAVADSPEAVARKWLQRHKPLLRWTNPAVEVIHDYSKPSQNGPTHVRFKQRIHGLPVDNGQIEVVVRADQVQKLVGHFLPEPTPTTVPVLSATAAAAKALASSSAPTAPVAVGEPVLAVVDAGVEENRPRAALAWRVTMQGGSGAWPSTVIAWINAANGSVLASSPIDFRAGALGAYQKTSHYDGANCVDDPAKVVLDPKTGTDLGCNQLPEYHWCHNFSRAAVSLDVQWRLGFNRRGWSGTGIPAPASDPTGPSLPADDSYRGMLVYTCEFRDDGWAEWKMPLLGGKYFKGELTVPGPFVALTARPAGIDLPSGTSWSADTLRHELGHGLLQAELGQRGDEALSDSAFIRQFHEHSGDFWALACNLSECGKWSTFDKLLWPGHPGTQDHSILECNHHSSGSLAPGDCPSRCEEFIHRNMWVDWVLDSSSRNEGLFKCRYACVLDAVAYRALEETTVTAHGVASKGLGYSAAQYVFYDVFTNANLSDDVFSWEHNYRSAVAKLAAKCSTSGPGGPPCRSDREAAVDGMDPYWGVGFWSQPRDLSSIAVTPAIRSPKDIATAAVKGEVFLFFVTRDGTPTPTTHLYVARFSDPIDSSTPPTVQELPSALPDTTNVVGIAATANVIPGLEKVSLAYVTDDIKKPNVRLAHYDLAAGTWTADTNTELASAISSPDRPALTYIGNYWLLAYTLSGSFSTSRPQLVAQNGASADNSSCPWSAAGGIALGKPFLLSPHFGIPFGAVLLYQDLYKPWSRRVNINMASNKVECGPPGTFNQLDPNPLKGKQLPDGSWENEHWDHPFAQPRKPVDTAYSFEDGVGGLTGTYFADRLQVFFPQNVQDATRALKQLSLGISQNANQVYKPDTETRPVAVVEAAVPGGAAIPVSFKHPLLGNILLLYRRGGPGSKDGDAVFVSYKKSD